MKKITILYKEDNKQLIDKANIAIDGKNIGELLKNKNKEIELEEGKHRITLSANTLKEINKTDNKNEVEIKTKENIWIDEEIEVNEDLYYIYHSPLIVSNKGKLEKVSKEEFEKRVKHNNFWNSEIGIGVAIVIIMIILFIL